MTEPGPRQARDQPPKPGIPEVAPAKGLGTTAAAVVGAPDVAAKLAEALELAIIRVPGIVAEPAKSMEAEAALVP